MQSIVGNNIYQKHMTHHRFIATASAQISYLGDQRTLEESPILGPGANRFTCQLAHGQNDNYGRWSICTCLADTVFWVASYLARGTHFWE